MKEFLYKSSFIRYFSALFTRSTFRERRAEWLWFATFYFILGFTGVLFNQWSLVTILLLFYGLYFGRISASTPNLVSLMPLTVRRKNVYRFLSPILATVLTIVIGWLIITVMFLFVVALSSIGTNNGIIIDFKEYITGPIKIIADDGVHVILFAVAFAVYCFATGITFGALRRKKQKIIFALCWGVISIICTRMICQPFVEYYSQQPYYFGLSLASPYDSRVYEHMDYPWLCTALCLVAAAASLAGSIVFIAKYTRIGIKR